MNLSSGDRRTINAQLLTRCFATLPPLTDFRVPIVRRPFRHAGQIHTSPNRLFIRHYCFPASMEIRGIKNLFFFERRLGVFRFSLRVGVESKFRGNFV